MSKTLETSIEISGVLSPSLQAAIKQAIGNLAEMSKETLESAGAAAKLAAEIDTQESVLKNLERGYADFVVSGEEGTQQARDLADHIQNLSTELDDNKDTLEGAYRAAGKLAEGMDNTGDEADKLKRTISQQEATLKKLKERYVALSLSEDDTSDESRELAREIQKLSGELTENKRKLKDAENAADQLDRTLDGMDGSVGNASEGFTVMKGALANLVADGFRAAIQWAKRLGGKVIELGRNFSGTMSEVQAISGASAEELEKLEATAREYGATTVFSASEAGEALKYMALAGWDANQSTDALGGVLNLAAASGMELGAASDMVTDYLSAFGMEANKASYFADLLSYAQSHSNTTAEALGEAYQNCAANLNAAGQDVETVTSLLEGMANQGYKGSRAGTALSAIMRDITNAMDKGQIKIGNTSVAVQDASGNFRDLTDILADVEKATDGMGSAEKAAALGATFTADSTKGLNLILNEGTDKIAGYEEALRGATGTAEEMADVMNDNLEGDLAEMHSALEELGLKIYDKVEPALRSAVQFVTDKAIPAIEWLGHHLPELGIALGTLSAVLVAMKWGSITTKITQAMGAFKALGAAIAGVSAPVLIVIGVVAVLAAAFTHLWRTNEEFRNKVTEIWDGVKAKFEEFGETITNKLNELGFNFESFTEVLGALWDGFCNLLAPLFEGVFQQIANVLSATLDVLVGLFDIFAGIFTGDWSRVWDGVKEVFGGVWDFVVNTFNNFIGVFTGLADTILGWFGTSWDELWGGVKNFFVETWESITSFFSDKLGKIKETATNVWTSISDFLSNIWETIKNVVQVGVMAVGGILKAAFDLITLPFRFIWENCKETVTAVWDGIKSKVSGALDSVKSSISTKLEAAKETVSNVTGRIKSVASDAWEAVSTAASTKWESIKTTIGSKISAARDRVSGVAESIKTTAGNAWSAVSTAASTKWESIRSTISSKLTSARDTVSSLMGSVKSSMASHLGGALSTVQSKFSSIYNSISGKMQAAKDAVGNAIQALKNKFNFSWSLPKLKLPHVSISGKFSLKPPQVPKFGISWYKDGGILTRPTIFGAAGGNLLAGGEAGAEAVLPLARLWEKLEEVLQRILNRNNPAGDTGAELTATAGKLLTLDDFSLGSLSNNGGVVVYYDFSGFTWSPQIQTNGSETDDGDFMAQLRAHEAEFFDWLDEFIHMREVACYA